MSDRFGIIGHPLGHSQSPFIQTYIYDQLGMNAVFHRYDVEESDLEATVEKMKVNGVKGFLVTVPYKTKIIHYLDKLDSFAEAMNAVNVVKLVDGYYVGTNVDGLAWLDASGQTELGEQRALIIGAGGAAQSIYYTLSQFAHLKIDVANRTVAKAERFQQFAPSRRFTKATSLAEAEAHQDQYDLIVQTTSIGMWPHHDQSPLKLTKLKDNVFVSDIIYNPLETKLLQQARLCGARTENGIGMLVLANVYAIKKWTGKQVSPSLVEKLVKKVTINLRSE